MQTPMFAFVGLLENKTEQDVDALEAILQESSALRNLEVTFKRKEELLSSRFEEAGFYVSLIAHPKEIKDWVKMAKDFEIDGGTTPITEAEFQALCRKKANEKPILYQDEHYMLARNIFTCLASFNGIKIFAWF